LLLGSDFSLLFEEQSQFRLSGIEEVVLFRFLFHSNECKP